VASPLLCLEVEVVLLAERRGKREPRTKPRAAAQFALLPGAVGVLVTETHCGPHRATMAATPRHEVHAVDENQASGGDNALPRSRTRRCG